MTFGSFGVPYGRQTGNQVFNDKSGIDSCPADFAFFFTLVFIIMQYDIVSTLRFSVFFRVRMRVVLTTTCLVYDLRPLKRRTCCLVATPFFMAWPSSRRSPVLCRHGCVACSQPLAAEAGLAVLKRGGNAADAAVAVAAALNVTEPCSTGIGGDCFCLFYDAATRSVRGLNGR